MEICWQEKAQEWCTKGKTKIYLAFISIFSLLFNIPTFYELDWRAGNGNVLWADSMWNRHATSYFVIYNVWLRLIIRYALPIICLVTLSTLIVIKVINQFSGGFGIYNLLIQSQGPSINDVGPFSQIHDPPPSPCRLSLLNRLMQ